MTARTDGGWQPPTGISPRPMLMGAPRNALRAFNAGVSLSQTRSHGRRAATHGCRLAESLAQILLSVRIMARHLLGFAPFRFVIRLPMKFSRYSRSALSGACDIWLWISQERLLSGDKNLSSRMHEWPVAEARKGGHAPARATMGFRLFCLP